MVKNNIDALRSVYLSLGGSLDDTYEDINGGSPVSAYRSVKDHIAAISKLDVGSGSYTETTTFYSGNATVVASTGDSPEILLEGIEGLDSSVQTVTVTIANATESNTYTLMYNDTFGIWADSSSPETFTVVLAPSRTSDDGFGLAMRAYDASDVGDTYNVTLAKEEVAKDFVDATVKAINQSGYPYITNNTGVYSGSVVVDEEHSGSPISITSDFPTDIPVESIPELTVKINGNPTTYSYSRGEHIFAYQTDDNDAQLVITQGSGDDAVIEYVDFKANLAGVYAITVNLYETTLDENFKAGVESVFPFELAHYTVYNSLSSDLDISGLPDVVNDGTTKLTNITQLAGKTGVELRWYKNIPFLPPANILTHLGGSVIGIVYSASSGMMVITEDTARIELIAPK